MRAGRDLARPRTSSRRIGFVSCRLSDGALIATGICFQMFLVIFSLYYITINGPAHKSGTSDVTHCTKPLSTIQCNKTLCQDQLDPYYS